MVTTAYYTAASKVDDIKDLFSASNWSVGICFTQDKSVAKELATVNEAYLYKCKLDLANTKTLNKKDISNRALQESLKSCGFDSLLIEQNRNCLPKLDKVVETVQYLVFKPECVQTISCTPLKYTLKESLQIHSQLNPNLFEDGRLKEEVRDRLIEIGDKFAADLQEAGIPLKVVDYWLVGSNAAYNYQPDSDVDLHIIVDTSEVDADPALLRLLYDYAKASITKNYDITIKGHPLEIYIEDSNASSVSNGVYSIKRDKWVKIPTPDEDRVLYPEETDKFKELLQQYYDLEDEDIEQFINNLYILRKDSLAAEGEFGLGNLIFKEFRNSGRLQQLKDRMYAAESKRLTLEGLNID